jgi:hypothetical protein
VSRETILEPDLPIIDPHHHLWERMLPPMPPGAAPPPLHPFLKVVFRRLKYLLPEFLADLRSGHNVRATVFIECGAFYKADGRNRPHQIGGVPTPLVGEQPERRRPKSRGSLPPSMPSTVTPRTSSIFTKAAALVVVPTHTSCAFAMACSRVMGPRSRSHPRPG